MKKLGATLLLLAAAVGTSTAAPSSTLAASAAANEAAYSAVDPFIGTGGEGHTYPGATVPYGMVQLSPDTRIQSRKDG